MKQSASHIETLVIHKLASRRTFAEQVRQKTALMLMVLLAVSVLFSKSGVAQPYSEYEIKAAFLCNFASFVEWPENTFDSDTSVFIIGILGEDPFGAVMERIAQSYTKRRIIIQRYSRVEMTVRCHILFVSSSNGDNLKDILDQLTGTSVLTVSDIEGFCALGGIVTFSKQKIKYGFEINRGAAKRADIKISSKLLRLAVKIYE